MLYFHFIFGVEYLNSVALTSSSSTFGLKRNSSVKANQWKYYSINVKKGKTVSIKLTNLNSDIDLYIRLGSKPIGDKYTKRSIKGGTTSEKITIKIGKSIKMYIGIYGYSDGGKFRLEVK